VAYITGRREFYGLNLMVDARVLDPRPDTETLVDWALEVLTGLHAPKVADLGTGSGAIALAIQHQRPDALVIATDASADALAVAETNAKRLNLPVRFALGPWLVPIATEPNSANHLQLIVSNPPYIADSDPHLTALHHEPRQALTSGSDGLDDIKHIVKNAPAHLRTGGWLLLEHGYDQASAVQDLLRAEGFDSIQTRQDLAGLDRCTGGSI
jgi:release factor glutamine methyltransferase